MPRCHRCGADNREGRRFCAACGDGLARVCAACEFSNELEEKYCGGCGRPLADPPAPPAPRRDYTPRHLATTVLTSRSALEGEHKQVTVLFCDLVESMRLAEQLAPEMLHQVMDQTLKLMAEAVHRHEGTVNQFLGDGIMALFGAPVALEDHALRAVQAALVIQESVAAYAARIEQEHGVSVRLRVGLNTGPVVVGRIGDDLRMDYTAIGDTTNLAARLQALAEPGTVLVSDGTHRLVQGHFRTEALGALEVKGRSQPVTAFRVLARRRRRNLFAVRAERGLTRLIGRDNELALLGTCWERAREGRGQAVGILGEPGVGKSRLLYEFRRIAGADPRIWLEVSCSSLGQSRPYLPLLDLLRAALGIDEGDGPAEIDEKIRASVRDLDPGLEKHAPFLRELFDLPGEAPALKHLDPTMKRRMTFDALRFFTVAGARHAPMVLLVEDLHWIDKSSEDYLSFFVQGMAGIPVLLITTYRQGYAVRWADRVTQITLDVLAERETDLMVRALLEAEDVPPDLLPRIREKAEGNPLALEEITRSLLERGILVKADGRVRWAASGQIGFPLTIQDIVRARIDRLEEPVKDTLRIASAIGREFDLRLLVRAAGPQADAEGHLGTLKQLELVHETGFFPELTLAFKHAVIQDVAYQSLLTPRRAALHGAIAAAIEELFGERIEEHATELAHHYGHTPHHERAFRHALTAGDRAARLLASTEAKTHYEQALAAARRQSLSPEAQRAEIDAILKLAAVGMTREDLARDQLNLEHAIAVARTLGDEARAAKALYWLGRIHYVSGDAARAVARAQESLVLADHLGDEAIAALPVNLMGRAYFSQSNFVEASRMMARSVEQMRRLGNTSEEATAEAWVGGLLGLLGEFDRGLPYLDHGIQLARQIEHPAAEAAAFYYRGIIHEQRGEPEAAIRDYEASRALAERMGDVFRIYVVKMFEARAWALAGDAARGRRLIEESDALAERLGTKFYIAMRKCHLAICLLAQSEATAVPDVCREAIRLAEETGDLYANGLAHRVLADALLGLTPPPLSEVETAVVKAVEIQERLDVRPELSRSYLTRSRVVRALGDSAAADALVGRASEMFRQMGMAWDLAQAERERRP